MIAIGLYPFSSGLQAAHILDVAVLTRDGQLIHRAAEKECVLGNSPRIRGKAKPPAYPPRAPKSIRLSLPHPTPLITSKTSSLGGSSSYKYVLEALSFLWN